MEENRQEQIKKDIKEVLVDGDEFILNISKMSDYIHRWAVGKGFWEQGDKRNEAELIMLMVTELAEACEGIRQGNNPSEHISEFSAAEEEFADTVIRIMDHCAAKGYRLGEAILAKMAFNETRPYKHGKMF